MKEKDENVRKICDRSEEMKEKKKKGRVYIEF